MELVIYLGHDVIYINILCYPLKAPVLYIQCCSGASSHCSLGWPPSVSIYSMSFETK